MCTGYKPHTLIYYLCVFLWKTWWIVFLKVFPLSFVYTPLLSPCLSFFNPLRNQAMRKKLILYFKRRNHARKQWVSRELYILVSLSMKDDAVKMGQLLLKWGAILSWPKRNRALGMVRCRCSRCAFREGLLFVKEKKKKNQHNKKMLLKNVLNSQALLMSASGWGRLGQPMGWALTLEPSRHQFKSTSLTANKVLLWNLHPSRRRKEIWWLSVYFRVGCRGGRGVTNSWCRARVSNSRPGGPHPARRGVQCPVPESGWPTEWLCYCENYRKVPPHARSRGSTAYLLACSTSRSSRTTET